MIVDEMYEAMTKLELLAALKTMTISEQLEVLEVASKIIREGLNVKTDLEIAAEKMQAYYVEGSDLAAFTDDNTEDFYEYSEYA
jgi:H2-forming N5,N10-methylenetetrahydromethanopterin dehydrogenase-like enzyme